VGSQKDFGSDESQSACKEGVFLETSDDRPASSLVSVRRDADGLGDCGNEKDLQRQDLSESG